MYKSNIIEVLRTYNVNSKKIRLGNINDGGYVINELLAQSTKKLISVGMGTEDSFEQEWVERYPNKSVEAYDACCECSDLCRKNPDKVNKSIFYVQQNVGYEKGNIPLNVIVDGKQDILLKVDIESAEYKVFDNVQLNDVTGLIIEVHDLHVRENREKLGKLIHEHFSNLLLFHVHGNSWGNTFDLNLSKNNNKGIIVKDFPYVMELSFINKKLVSQYELETCEFPVLNIDFSNKPDASDIDLYWINAL